jgi:uncharacterized RDD family membrane protein YckC
MKFKSPSTLFALVLALAWAVLPVLRAREDAPPPTNAAPAGPTAPADPKAVEQAKPPGATSPADAGKPVADGAVAAAVDASDAKTTEPEVTKTSASGAAEPAPEENEPVAHKSKQRQRHHSNTERVSFFHDSTLAAGETADAVVSILGSSTSAGEVSDAVVSVLGSSTSSGNVGDAVVSVIGDTHVTGGTVGDSAVAVLGTTFVDSHVNGQVVAVLGNVELGPNAVVDGDVVCIGGTLIKDPKAVVHGDVQNIAVGGHSFNFNGLHAWFAECVLYARPLAFDVRVLWAWGVALVFLGFYALLALVAPAGVLKCVQTLEERPGKSILAGFLTLLLTPVAYLLLVLTLVIAIGVVLIPLFSLGLFAAALFGKVVMLAWIGRRIFKLFGDDAPTRPVLAVLVGGVIVLLLYTVPVLGFIVYKLMGVLGLGVVLYTLLLASKRNKPVPAAPLAATGAMEPPVAGEAGASAATLVPPLPPIISAVTLPRAGFWIRLAAVLLDCVLFGMVFSFLGHLVRPLGGGFPLWFAVYNVLMWGAKGTTIGGIICGLKIVRLDDRRVDWGVAVVRGLGGFLSLAVAGLGFIWVAFDNERQSWHDKIAGTTIVKVPRGTPLV